MKAWTICKCGCGVYRNTETGLIRKFPHGAPLRGKWEFKEHIRRPLPNGVRVEWFAYGAATGGGQG